MQNEKWTEKQQKPLYENGQVQRSSRKNNKTRKYQNKNKNNHNHKVGTILAIFQRPLKVVIVFSCNCKMAFEVPMSILTNKNAIIII